MAFIAVDSYSSSIASIAGGTGITSFTVSNGSGLPTLAAGDFTVFRIDDAGTPEDLVVTAISGVNITCLPTTIAHANGNSVDAAILDAANAFKQIKDDVHSGFPVNALSAGGALVKGTGIRNHITASAADTYTLADGTYTGELCRISVDRTSVGQVTVNPAGATTWDNLATIALFAGEVIIGTWNGTSWITLEKFSAFVPVGPKFLATQWYWSAAATLGASGLSNSTTTRYTPFYIDQAVTISDLGTRVNTLSGGGNFCIGIYANDPTTNRPGVLLGQTGNISTGSAGAVSGALSANVQLTPGLYWFAFQVDNATANFQGINSTNSFSGFMGGATSIANLNNGSTTVGPHLTSTSTYGTFANNPTITESVSGSLLPYLVAFKVASVP